MNILKTGTVNGLKTVLLILVAMLVVVLILFVANALADGMAGRNNKRLEAKKLVKEESIVIPDRFILVDTSKIKLPGYINEYMKIYVVEDTKTGDIYAIPSSQKVMIKLEVKDE